jgi:radical SAM protein with 4Fe4S-binding SPASM domain
MGGINMEHSTIKNNTDLTIHHYHEVVSLGKINDTHAVYFPLAQQVLLLDESKHNTLLSTKKVTIGDKLEGIIKEKTDSNTKIAQTWRPQTVGDRFAGTIVYLLPTDDCNLRCTYCYSAAGEFSKKRMNLSIAQDAVKNAFNNALVFKKSGKNVPADIRFLGGGEPTFDWSLFVSIVEYAHKLRDQYLIPLRMEVVTNCVLTVERASWLGDNFDIIHASVDGPPIIQNKQRPLPNGNESSTIVYNALKTICNSKAAVRVHMIVTELASGKLDQIVKWFYDEFPKIRTIHVEPGSITPFGRASFKPTETDKFVEDFIKAYEMADSLGRSGQLQTSRMQTVVNSSFCKSTQGRAVYVNPDGMVTNCNEVSQPNDQRINNFYLGSVSNGRIKLDPSAAQNVIENAYQNNTRLDCDGCIAKWNCRGGCRASYLSNPEIFIKNHCGIVKPLTKWFVIRSTQKAINEGKVVEPEYIIQGVKGLVNVEINSLAMPNPI